MHDFVVLDTNVVFTASAKIIYVTHEKPVEYAGRGPASSVVIPGAYPKNFPADGYPVSRALIIGKYKESANKKTSLNDSIIQRLRLEIS